MRSFKTVSALSTFFLAMALYPDVQARAHAELDTMVGQNRMPDFPDRQKLTFVGAVLIEVIRWQPVLPLGFLECLMDIAYADRFFRGISYR
jgi:cytochrome P450